MRDREDAVWLHVSFDLPTTTPEQKRNYRHFREFLMKSGFSMSQFSVYIRYLRRASEAGPVGAQITAEVPPGGRVVLLTLSDHCWAQALRFSNGEPVSGGEPPDQLELF